MLEIMELAHKFLQNFCYCNTQNQALLHKYLDRFLSCGLGVSENIFFLIDKMSEESIFSFFFFLSYNETVGGPFRVELDFCQMTIWFTVKWQEREFIARSTSFCAKRDTKLKQVFTKFLS